MNEPIRILSDLHLGHKVSRIGQVAALRPLLAGMGTVVFNGDTWEEMGQQYCGHSAAMLEELRELCAGEGATAVFLSGNHDPGWPGPGWLELANGRVIVTHGDALMHDSSPWKREILNSQQQVKELWQRFPAANHDPEERVRIAREIACLLRSAEYPKGRGFIQRAWDAALPPQRAFMMIHAWCTQGAMGARFCERYFPQAEALVVGHLHQRGCWVSKGRLVINTGSFVSPGRAHCVTWHDGWLARAEIDEFPDLCRPGRILGMWRFS